MSSSKEVLKYVRTLNKRGPCPKHSALGSPSSSSPLLLTGNFISVPFSQHGEKRVFSDIFQDTTSRLFGHLFFAGLFLRSFKFCVNNVIQVYSIASSFQDQNEALACWPPKFHSQVTFKKNRQRHRILNIKEKRQLRTNKSLLGFLL